MQRRTVQLQYDQTRMYPEHPTALRSERLRATRAGLGRTLREQTLRRVPTELPSKDAVYMARPFEEENAAAGVDTPELISPGSLLGHHLRRKTRVNK